MTTPATTSAEIPVADITQHILYQHISALLAVQQAANAFVEESVDPDDCSPEEKALCNALADQNLIKGNEVLMMHMLKEILLFVMPGEPILCDKIGIAPMHSKDGDRALSIFMRLQPGKDVMMILERKDAEVIEQRLKKELDQLYGRLIKF